MKKFSREKLTLLILVMILFILGSGLLIWQRLDNKSIISSLATSQYQEKQIYDNRGDGQKNNIEQNLENIEKTNQSQEGINSNNSKLIVVNDDKSESTNIMIHVAGQVVNPGVYEMSTDSRVVHAVELAGGATSMANLDGINLASIIYDGEKIYIPSVIEKMNQINNGINNDTIGSFQSSFTGNSRGKININTAAASSLEELSGIGPSKAKSIIDYRSDNGPFKDVEELLQVSGIGEKTLAKIKDDIVVR